MRVAAGQAVSVTGDLGANVATAARLTASAAADGVRVLVLPEAFLTGYDAGGFREAGRLTNSTHLYDPARDAWTEGPPMHDARLNAKE